MKPPMCTLRSPCWVQDDQGNPDFRQGYVNLPVDPSFEYLNVTLTSTP